MLLASTDGGVDLGLALWGVVFLPGLLGVSAGAVTVHRSTRVLVGVSVFAPTVVLALLVWNAAHGRSTWLPFGGWALATVVYLSALWLVAAPWRRSRAGWRGTARLVVRGAFGTLGGGVLGGIAVAALAGYLVSTVTWRMVGVASGAVVGVLAATISARRETLGIDTM